MKRASLFAGALVASIIAAGSVVPSAFAQGTGGPFADVPVDHWAYKAVDTLQKDGIVIGYPDGTYGGKRAMTRYEFAVAIARLLEKIPQPSQVDLTPYVKKDDLTGILAPYALKSDLAGFAKQSDLDLLKHMVEEFQTELTTLGVDLDAVKHRLDALEGRVNALETAFKRVTVYGDTSIMARGNNTFSNSAFVTDADGYKVARTTGANYPHNTLYDTSVLHDVDLGVKVRLSDTATADTLINYGNYLPYLGGIASYSNATSNIGRSATDGYTVNQTEAFNVYKATVEASAKIPYIGGVGVTVGRMPLQLTPYTLKLIDVDSYFYNAKTDLGDIPMDGGKLTFKLGPVAASAFAAKTDPIAFVSDENSVVANSTGTGGYGIFAGAAQGAFGRGVVGSDGFATSFRPEGSLINPNVVGATPGNGAMRVEQLAGVRAQFVLSHINIGGTYMALAGNNTNINFDPVPAVGTNNALYFNRVFVYGGDANTNINKWIGLKGDYTKSDTGGPRYADGGGSVDIGTHSDITNKNDAWDAALTLTPGAFTIVGGYKNIGPYFGAPGYWEKLGSWTNPVDIKGPYVTGKWAITSTLAFEAAGKFYEGTGEAINNGGISTSDKITNAKAGFKYALTSPSSIGLGVEETQYKIGEGINAGQKPTEYFVNAGYGYSFTPASSFKVGYQWINYVDHNTGFDPNGSQRGGVAYTQFSVKF